jgi:hypothetical protein
MVMTIFLSNRQKYFSPGKMPGAAEKPMLKGEDRLAPLGAEQVSTNKIDPLR